MKKSVKPKTSYDDELSRPVQLGHLSDVRASDDEIMSVLAFLNSFMTLDARLEHIDFSKYEASKKYAPSTAMAMYYEYLRKLPPVTNPVIALSTLSERNDLILSIDRVQVREEPDDDKAFPAQQVDIKMGVPKIGGLKDFEVLAMVIAELIAYSTTFDGEKLGIVIDAKKAKKLGVPYVSLLNARSVLNVGGLQAGQARDVMYEKLKKDWRLVYTLSDMIYREPSLKAMAENNLEKLEFFNKNKGKYAPLKSLYIPKLNSFNINSCTVVETTLRYLSDCRGVRGADTRGIGVISVGYMWYDMTRSLFVDLSMAQDLLSLARKLGLRAVKSNSINGRIIKILVANKLSVYSPQASSHEPKVANGEFANPGYYISGQYPSFAFVDLMVESSVVTAKSVDHPHIDGKLATLAEYPGLTCAYFYIHPALSNSKLRMFPSFRAHSGMLIVTNLQRADDEDDNFSTIVSRVYESNHCRNLYPFTRTGYCSQDPYLSYFLKDIIIPRNIPRKDSPFLSVIEYKEVVVEQRDNYYLDLSVVEQVQMEVSNESLIRAFHHEVGLVPKDGIVQFLRECFEYPLHIVQSSFFTMLVSRGYNINDDEVISTLYGQVLSLLNEKKPPIIIDENPNIDQKIITENNEEEDSDASNDVEPANEVTQKIVFVAPPVVAVSSPSNLLKPTSKKPF